MGEWSQKWRKNKNCWWQTYIRAIHVIKLRDLKAFLANPFFFVLPLLRSLLTRYTYTFTFYGSYIYFMHQVQQKQQQNSASQSAQKKKRVDASIHAAAVVDDDESKIKKRAWK